jgi:hypothetical protein
MLVPVPMTSESSDQEPARWDERDWEDLLDDVADRSIIPIVGSELLTVEFERGHVPTVPRTGGKTRATTPTTYQVTQRAPNAQ